MFDQIVDYDYLQPSDQVLSIYLTFALLHSTLIHTLTYSYILHSVVENTDLIRYLPEDLYYFLTIEAKEMFEESK